MKKLSDQKDNNIKYVKNVKCSFYSTDHYPAKFFYKPISNC